VLSDLQRCSPQQDPWYAPFYFLLTCCFDVIGTTLGGIGLLVRWMHCLPGLVIVILISQPFFRRQYTYASVFQMLRGSIIVFSGILSVLFLKRCALITFIDTPRPEELLTWQNFWVVVESSTQPGSSTSTTGWGSPSPRWDSRAWASPLSFPIQVRCASASASPSSPQLSLALVSCRPTGGRDIKEVILGDVLIILGQLSNAIQMIIEEIFLKRRNVRRLRLVPLTARN